MPHPGLPVTLLALALPVLAAGDRAPARPRVTVTQWTMNERVVIRVPRMAGPVPVAPQPIRWKEKKGPKCIAAQAMAGALITARDQVDLVLAGGKRVRVKLDGECRQLDYYGGFYFRPSADGMICADRDALRVRSGASCGIDQFRSLQPVR